MKLLTVINNNMHEWRQLAQFDSTKPRLPLPYMLGGSFMVAGHSVYALDTAGKAALQDPQPFQAIFQTPVSLAALQAVDVAILWGSDGLRAMLKDAVRLAAKKRILYFSYVFSPEAPTPKQRLVDLSLHALAGSSKGLILMTGHQARKAEQRLGRRLPVIRMRCGIDTAFYRSSTSPDDVPEQSRSIVSKLLTEPYVILPGDELRYNDDALEFVRRSGIRLVRVSQYSKKSGTEKLKADVAAHGLQDRLVVFEKISYRFLRFLLRNASAYAGFVDSSWQPAGWTVACEALACGLPVVTYDGLVTREMAEAGAPADCVHRVVARDIRTATDVLAALVDRRGEGVSSRATSFAEANLDFTRTAPPFVKALERLLDA